MNDIDPTLYYLHPFVQLGIKLTLILALTWFVVLLTRKHNPSHRLLLLRFAAFSVLVLPFLYIIVPTIDLPLYTQQPVSEISTGNLEGRLTSKPTSYPIAQDENITVPIENTIQTPAVLETDVSTTATQQETNHFIVSSEIVLAIWLLGSFAIGLYFLIRHNQIKRLLKRSSPAPQFAQSSLLQICDEMGITKAISLRYMKHAITPFVYGIQKPMVVLPPRILEEEYKTDLEAIFAHELSHIRSNDLLWKSLFQWIQTILWFNPFAWLIRKSHDAVCEQLSDAKAALYVGDTKAYSQTLARVTLDLLTNPPVYSGVSMAKLPEIRQRIEILKDKIPFTPLSRSSSLACMVTGGILVSVLAGMQFVNAASESILSSSVNPPKYQTGEKWVYTHVGCRTGGSLIGQPVQGDRIREVVRIVEDDDKKWTLIKETWGDDDYNPPRMLIDDQGLVHKIEEGASILNFIPAIEWDWSHLKPDEEIELETIIKDENNQGTFAIKGKRLEDETIRVPAGTFENCQQISLVMSYTPMNQTISQSYGYFTKWYHPSVNGLVKEKVKFQPLDTESRNIYKSGNISGLINMIKMKIENIGEGYDANTKTGTSLLKTYIYPK